jgi:hypothetical protein
MNQFRARIRWLSPEEGGRREPPSGDQYITVARFADPAGDWSSDAWSVVLRFDDSAEEACVSFLVNDAPAHLLQSGTMFELYEGSRKVADVRVV